MIANQYPRKKGLYLAYNAALKKDAEVKFPRWVDCKTVHGLAYREFGARYKKQLFSKPDNYRMIASLNIDSFSFSLAQEKGEFSSFKMLRFCREIVRRFAYSERSEITFEDAKTFTRQVICKEYPILQLEKNEEEEGSHKNLEIKSRNDSIKSVVFDLNNALFTYATAFWREQINPRNDEVPAEHDTYLKLYQLSKPKIQGYDYIMLDEAQDANPCILDILSHQTCQIIYVGDRYQQIYAFRGTINAMDKIEGDMLYLTQSFRFGDVIAKEANTVLEKLGSSASIKGFSVLQSRLDEVQTPYTFIARTNSTLIQECIDKIQKGYKCCLLSDTQSIINLLRSLFYLWKDQPRLIKDERVAFFKSFLDLRAFAKEEEENELLSATDFVLKNGDETPSILRLLEDLATYPERKADIVFSTAHKSKGREWNNVALSKTDFSLKKDDEKCLYYVALTRAKNILDHSFPIDALAA